MADLHSRGVETLLACWTHIARGVPAASVRRLAGVDVAVFPEGPERAIYNNAVLAQGAGGEAVDAMEAAYAAAGIEGFAAWVHESDAAMCAELSRRGYAIEETTRAMGMALDDVRVPRQELELAAPSFAEHLRVIDVPPGFLAGVDGAALHTPVVRRGGESVASGMAFDHEGDCGIFNVVTVEHARRRGLGTALTALLVHDARARGCTTATLQATPVAEGVYAAVGFQDLGRFLEHVKR